RSGEVSGDRVEIRVVPHYDIAVRHGREHGQHRAVHHHVVERGGAPTAPALTRQRDMTAHVSATRVLDIRSGDILKVPGATEDGNELVPGYRVVGNEPDVLYAHRTRGELVRSDNELPAVLRLDITDRGLADRAERKVRLVLRRLRAVKQDRRYV